MCPDPSSIAWVFLDLCFKKNADVGNVNGYDQGVGGKPSSFGGYGIKH